MAMNSLKEKMQKILTGDTLIYKKKKGRMQMCLLLA